VTTLSSTLAVTGAGTIQSLTVGRGGGAVATNTAVGQSAMAATASGTENTALGREALTALLSGGQNTGLGRSALAGNTTGSSNTGAGTGSLVSNTTGSFCTSIGAGALNSNTIASNNTAVGYQAGYSNTTGGANTFFGYLAGYSSNAVNGSNVFIGYRAGKDITTGVSNVVLGGYQGNQGGLDIRTASNHIVLSDGDGNPRLYFDNNAVCRIENAAGGTGALRVRNTTNVSGDLGIISNLGSNTQNTSSYFFIGSTPGVSDKIYIYGNGNIQNTNNSYGGISDAKLKENIVDASPKLADLMQVRVRNYNLKTDPTHKQLGVVAQELETVFPALVDVSPDRDEDGNTLETTTKSVKYSVFVPMLIKAIQEQQALITALTTRITALEQA